MGSGAAHEPPLGGRNSCSLGSCLLLFLEARMEQTLAAETSRLQRALAEANARATTAAARAEAVCRLFFQLAVFGVSRNRAPTNQCLGQQ